MTATIDHATDLYAEFRKQANRSPNKPISQKILDSRLVMAKGVNLDHLTKQKLLACAPFDRTCVVFTTEPTYKNQPFSQAAGFSLGAVLYDEPEEEMHLFAITKGDRIALVPKAMTDQIHEGLVNWLVPIWAHVAEKGATKDWWGKTVHSFIREQDELPPEFYVPGLYRTQGSAKDKGLELASWARDVRASIKLRVERSGRALSQKKRDWFEGRGYQLWDQGEMMDPQPENLLLRRGYGPKKPNEWLAAKMWRSTAYLRNPEEQHIPSARISTI